MQDYGSSQTNSPTTTSEPTSDSSEAPWTLLLKEMMVLGENKGLEYTPYKPQREFHEAGKTYRQRLLMGGNRCGKTVSGGMETSFHTTGLYPEWWTGRRFKRPIKCIVAGRTAETTRDVIQLQLLGEPGNYGTGSIPKHAIGRLVAGKGLTDAVDSMTVQHVTGGFSTINFKQYSQERQAFEGYKADLVWFDEEPPTGVYNEGVTRTHDSDGITFITFTPLLGHSDVVRQFYPSPMGPMQHLTRMGIRDVGHFSKVQADQIIASYPIHEREARANGEPTLGRGKIFPIDPEIYLEDPIRVPDHWFQVGGIDFGYDHPTACVKLAYDRDADIVHVTHAYKQAEATPIVHASWMKGVGGDWLPWAWPKDGYQRDKQSGNQLKDNYRDQQGIYMLPNHAQFQGGSVGVEEGIMEMFDRLQTARLMIDRNLVGVTDEIGVYHRDEKGAVVKERDDLLCAIRYALMMLRYAVQRGKDSFTNLTRVDSDPLNPSTQGAF